MKININLKKGLFNDRYYPMLFNYTHRYEVYYGGAGSGKSHFVFQKIVLKAFREKRKILVVRKVAKTNRDSTFQMTLDTLARFKMTPFCTVNKTNMTITLPNGSVILFYGLDDVEKLKSIANITDIVCEECSEMSLDEVTQLDLRLRSRSDFLQMYFMFNPVSKANWTYTKWFCGGEIPETTFILKTTYQDNRFLPGDYIRSLEEMQKTNPTMYRIYTLGEFCSLDKLVFPFIQKKIISEQEIKALPLWVGLDFGYVNDPSALTWGRIDVRKKLLYITGEYHKKGMTNPEIAQVIKNLGLAKEIIVADSAEQKSIEEIRRAGIHRIRPAVKGADSVRHGLDTMQSYQIIVDERCANTLEEFENYTWQKDKSTGEYINKPVDLFNHHIDSIRYGIQSVIKKTGVRF